MGFLFKRKTYYLVFFFSKYLLISSIGLGIMFLGLHIPLVLILFFKLLFWGATYIFQLENKFNRRLIFYNNLGLSKNKLFFISFLFDSLSLILIFILLNFWF